MYDQLAEDRGEELRRLNREHLAELEAEARERGERLGAAAAAAGTLSLPPHRCC